jgi:hypothetical protein
MGNAQTDDLGEDSSDVANESFKSKAFIEERARFLGAA